MNTIASLSFKETGIPELDLDPIKVKLMGSEEGENWSLEKVDSVGKSYKRFMFLILKYPGTQIAPSKDVDTFWHYHILDTMKYAEDCQLIFGHFIHHFPYLGMRGEEDKKQLQIAGNRTKELLTIEFGTFEWSAGTADCSGNNCTNCEPAGCASSCDASQCSPSIAAMQHFDRPKLIREQLSAVS